MQVLQRLISVLTALTLAIAFFGIGLGACLIPPVTHLLANASAHDADSPFDRSQLVIAADATREYSFGAHDKLALYQAIYGIDRDYLESLEKLGGSVEAGFPRIDSVTDESSLEQLAYAFQDASEVYCYTPNTISHLDDCNKVISLAGPLLIASAILAIGGLIACTFLGKRRLAGGALTSASIVVVVVMVALGLWAALDFNGFFTSFHQMFFSQGNWTFPYDSLLICALPAEFWMGMGIIWLVVSLVVSILSFVIGRKLR